MSLTRRLISSRSSATTGLSRTIEVSSKTLLSASDGT
jgi:hypothetical protein